MYNRPGLCKQCGEIFRDAPPICAACILRNHVIFEWEGALKASTPNALRVIGMILSAAIATRDPFFLNNPFRALAQLTDAINSGSIEEASRVASGVTVH